MILNKCIAGSVKNEIKPIRSEADYQATLKEIEKLIESQPGTPEGGRMDVVVTLVEAY